MELHPEPERIVFATVSVVGLVAQFIYLYTAFVHAGRLDRMKIFGDLREQIGPHWEAEFGLLYIVFVGAVLGILSFTAPVAPRTPFSIVASITFTGVIIAAEIIAYMIFRRRVKALNGRVKKAR